MTLQDKLNSLSGDCLEAVKTYTQLEAKNAVLNPVIASACHQLIDKFCQKEVRLDPGNNVASERGARYLRGENLKGRRNTQHNDTQHNDTQHNDTLH